MQWKSVEGWVLDLDERRPRSLPKFEFVPTRLALFGDQGEPTDWRVGRTGEWGLKRYRADLRVGY